MWLVFFPYLGLRDDVVVGPWQLTPAEAYDGPWPSDGYKRTSQALLSKHRDAGGKPIERMTVAVRSDGVLSPTQPDDEEITRLRRAVQLAVLTANPPWHPDADGWSASTSDNCDLHMWGIVEDQEGFAVERGAVVRNLTGGLRFARETDTIPAPLELHLGMISRIDADIADAAYRALEGDPALRAPLSVDRFGQAIDWLERAWRNSPAIPWDVRANFLKIGFENLLGVSGAWPQAKAIRRRFELLLDDFGGGFDDLAWGPDETASRTVSVGGNDQACTDLQHWYVTFYRHRNTTEHPDAEPVGPMYEQGTAFDGPIFQTGERVLRDLLRVELSFAFGEPLYSSTLHRAIARTLRGLDA